MRGQPPAPLPPPFEDVLPSGLLVKWRMPDPFAIIAFDGVVPDPLTAAVITTLREEKAYTDETDPRKFRYDAQSVMGMYGVAAAMLEEPKLDPSEAYGDGNGTLGRREIGLLDVCRLYWLFRVGTRQTPRDITAPAQPERAADTGSDRPALSPDPSGASGGE